MEAPALVNKVSKTGGCSVEVPALVNKVFKTEGYSVEVPLTGLHTPQNYPERLLLLRCCKGSGFLTQTSMQYCRYGSFHLTHLSGK